MFHSMTELSKRYRFAFRLALRHIFVCIFIASVAAILVYHVWYPLPYREMLGVGKIFIILLGVDIICGPVLTLLLADPKKSKREMALDFSLIGIIQMAALIYGLHAVYVGRPVIVAFEVDRLTVVTANEIDHTTLQKAIPDFQRLPMSGITHVAVRKPRNSIEMLQSVDLSLAGFPPAMRPEWWETMDGHHEKIRAVTKPVAELLSRRPNDAHLLNEAIAGTGYSREQLSYLPFTSSKNKDWVALLNNSLETVGYAPVDGF